jgi:hypothetical protein
MAGAGMEAEFSLLRKFVKVPPEDKKLRSRLAGACGVAKLQEESRAHYRLC